MDISRICVRSFFSSAFSHHRRIRKKIVTMALGAAFMLALAAFVFNAQLAYAVYFNGEEVGVVKTRAMATVLVQEAERELSDILGYEYSLADAVSVAADIGAAPAEPAVLQKAIVSGVDEVCEMYAISVGGTVVGAHEQESALTEITDGLLRAYAPQGAEAARFAQTVEISKTLVSSDTPRDPDVIRMLLDPENEGSDYRLAVEAIVTDTRTEAIPYDRSFTEDGTLYEGDEAIVIHGEPGVRAITSRASYVNGTLRSVALVGSVVQRAPVTELVARGTMPRPATASYGEYIWPSDGVVTSDFGYRRVAVGSSNHQGIDIGGSRGQPIVAADGGEVIFSGWCNGYGYMVKIRHDNGDLTYYAHCCELLVAEGELVARGQQIGKMGSTGVSSGVHCHFEIRPGGEAPVDPMLYLP